MSGDQAHAQERLFLSQELVDEKGQQEEAMAVFGWSLSQWGVCARTAGALRGPELRGCCKSLSLLSRLVVLKLGSTMESLWEL